MKHKFLAGFLSIAIILSLGGSVLAYSLLGPKWSSSTIAYYVPVNISAANTNSYTNAASNWTASTNATLNKTIGVGICCTAGSFSKVDWDGNTLSGYNGAYFTSSTCTLNTYFTDNYSTNKIRSVAAHELGHALGLADLGTSANALMNGHTFNRYDSKGIYTAQTDDKNGVNSLY